MSGDLEALYKRLGDSMDHATFEQILEMDDEDEEREFSSSIVVGFFEQAHQTFADIDKRLKEKDLETLSSLGHYLKGSSATLGLTHIKNICEKIQHLGKGFDETGHTPKPEKECLEQITKEFEKLKTEYEDIEKALQVFFDTEAK